MTTTATPRSTVVVRVVLAALAAAVVNTGIALAASALDDGGIGKGLNPAAYLSLTIVGFLVAMVGWTLIARRAPKALRIIVPVALVLSWIPDLLLLTAGATAANVIGLMLMHTVVATTVVLVGRRDLRAAPPA